MPLPRDARVWIERTIAQLALEGPGNRLVDFAGQAVFDDPLVGVADGDDPLFERFRSVVSPRHLLPREVLSRYCAADADLSHVSVIVWALPFTEEIRRSNRGPDWPSELYSVARNNGGALNDEIRRDLTKMLRSPRPDEDAAGFWLGGCGAGSGEGVRRFSLRRAHFQFVMV